jgi:hypothetical protein
MEIKEAIRIAFKKFIAPELDKIKERSGNFSV